jgi:hypothetical protein
MFSLLSNIPSFFWENSENEYKRLKAYDLDLVSLIGRYNKIMDKDTYSELPSNSNEKVLWKDIKPLFEEFNQVLLEILKNSEVIEILQKTDMHFNKCYEKYQNKEYNEKEYKRYLKCKEASIQNIKWDDKHNISDTPRIISKTNKPSWLSKINNPTQLNIEIDFYPRIMPPSTPTTRSTGWLSEVKEIKNQEQYRFFIFCFNMCENLKKNLRR